MATSPRVPDSRLVETYERVFTLLARAGYAARAAVYVLVGAFALLIRGA